MILVNAYFDLFGGHHFDITISAQDGRVVEVYKDAHTFQKPVGVPPGYWKTILMAAFLQFSSMTNKGGSFNGKRWSLERGVKHTDVLSVEEIRLILIGQCLYDSLTKTWTEKIGPPTVRTLRHENLRNDLR